MARGFCTSTWACSVGDQREGQSSRVGDPSLSLFDDM